MRPENRIDYIEIPVTDLPKARAFLETMFGWTFQEWGDEYFSFNDGSLGGGLRKADEPAPATGVLLIFYSEDLERDVVRVTGAWRHHHPGHFPIPWRSPFSFYRPRWHGIRHLVGQHHGVTESQPWPS